MLGRVVIVLALCLPLYVSAELVPAEVFAKLPSLSDPVVSPTGQYVAA